MACRTTTTTSKPLQMITFVTIFVLHMTASVRSLTPPDHLVPPPTSLPFGKSTETSYYKYANSHNVIAPTEAANTESGVMTRIARWFGFFGDGQQPNEQRISTPTYKNNDPAVASAKSAYFYNKPEQTEGQQQQLPCNLCNKYPWVPMLQPTNQYNVHTNNWTPHMYPLNQAPSQISHRQRAVKFNLPPPLNPQVPGAPSSLPYGGNLVPNIPKPAFVPIAPPPQLSVSAMPPLYKAQLFRPIPTNNLVSHQLNKQQQFDAPLRFEQYKENIAAHSEIQPDRVVPSSSALTNYNNKNKSNANADIEIIKSHQITDFVSSVEYPPTFIQSASIDLALAHNNAAMPSNHKPSEDSVDTVHFKHENFNAVANSHLPASHIITELGNFETLQTTLAPEMSEGTTLDYNKSYYADYLPINTYESVATGNTYADNLPSASAHNATKVEQFIRTETLPYATNSPQSGNSETNTAITEIIPSVQTALIHRREKQNYQETPKTLANFPITDTLHVPNVPRPFARDPNPSALINRHNSKFTQTHQNSVTPEVGQNANSFSESWHTHIRKNPTPTADASGQYSGISPPNKPSTPLTIPAYTAKAQPRPFEPSREASSITSHFVAFDKLPPNKGLPEELEKTNRPTAPKYLTKILASNLRELLRREHLANSKTKPYTLDISTLQKNIDDWTEQEYTSLSHRPSTPTIRGRSKNIPNDYLTTPSPTPRNHKATKSLSPNAKELSTSINNLEPILFNRNSLKHFHASSFERKNHINNEFQTIPTSTPSTTSYDTSTLAFDETTTQFTPYYIRTASLHEPAELWKKAKVAISPKTMEKVYVVTPQPNFLPLRYVNTELSSSSATDVGSENAHNTPRFSVRPTPGKGAHYAQPHVQFPKPSKTFYETVDNFGLKGLSAFVPDKPVEISDGNSKVVTVASPPNMLKKFNSDRQSADDKNGVPPKQTIAPSPR